MNVIFTIEEKVPYFSSLSFLCKAMLRALTQEKFIVLENIGALGFDWEVCLFYHNGDQHTLLNCRVLRA